MAVCNAFQAAMKTRAQHLLALAGTACLLLAALPAAAQSKKLGAYTGTVSLSGTQMGPEVKYAATVTLAMPITSRSDGRENGEFLTNEAPNGKVLLTQWNESYTQATAGADGKFSSYQCALAKPVEVPVSVTGVLDIDLKAKRHAFSVTVLSLKDFKLDCVSSRSGPYKKDMGLALSMGTGIPGEHYKTPLPFADVARLAAKHTLVPTGELKKTHGPIVQEWDFKRTP